MSRVRKILKWGLAVSLILSISVILLLKTQFGLTTLVRFLPADVVIEKARGTATDFSAQKIGYTVSGTALSMGPVKLKWRAFDLIRGRLHVENAVINDLSVNLAVATDNDDTLYQPWTGVELPIDVLIGRAKVNGLRVTQDNKELFSADSFSASLSAIDSIVELRDLELVQGENTASFKAKVDLENITGGEVNISNAVNWTVDGNTTSFSGSLDGNWSELHLSQNLKSPFAAQLNASFRQVLTDKVSFEVFLKGVDKVGQGIAPDFIDHSVTLKSGMMEFSGVVSPGLGLEGANIIIGGDGEIEIVDHGLWAADITAKFDGRDLSIEKLDLQSSDGLGHLNIDGTIEEMMDFVKLSGGEASLMGQWQNISVMLPSLSGAINSTGSFAVVGPSSEVRITLESSGSALGVTNRISGDFIAAESFVNVNKLSLITPQTVIGASGVLAQSSDLIWTIDSKNIGEFLPSASGELVLTGSLQGPLSRPDIELNGSTAALQYDNILLKGFSVDAGLSASNLEAPLNVDLELGELSVDGQPMVADVAMQVNGTMSDHRSKLNAILANSSPLMLEFKGQVGQASASSDYHWSGDVSTLDLDDTIAGDWSLRDSASVSYKNGLYRLSPTCMVSHQQSVCVEGHKDIAGQRLKGRVRSLQLAMLNTLIQSSDVTLDGALDGEFEYQYDGKTKGPSVTARLNAEQGTINWLEIEEESSVPKFIDFNDFTMTLNQAATLSFLSNMELDQAGRFSLDVSVGAPYGSTEFDTATLAGTSFLMIDDLDALPPSFFGGVELNGKLDSRASLSGTPTKPAISLNGGLTDARFEIPELGVVLDQITLNATTNSRSQIELQGTTRLGDGELILDGILDLSDFAKPSFSVDATGNNLSLAQTNELTVVGDVKLNAKINSALAKVRGGIHIDRADIDLKLPETAVLASNDVVLKGAEFDRTQMMQDIDITIDLGENTHIQAQGLDAMLIGSLRAYQSPQSILRGDGRIDIKNGRYQAYGQKLDIDEGRLVFNGGSIDDPGLQFRAQKTVEEITAGVQVSGRASAPSLNLYSTPSMSDQDVLSVLIFGKSISALGSKDGLVLLQIANSLRGDGRSTITQLTQDLQSRLGLTDLQLNLVGSTPNIQAGKQLSSRFYVGYGYGLLDAAQSLMLRYTLSRAWSIKADLGTDSGADLRYQIER
ncbi:hypothetical protein NBRC116583_02130 [Arenicella sp. 4NH20-0111]|uniref:translocation/assembly module TamB domain-containing protein n=1 Tax=Arenicella sp. 4NH20-0111 TaxID=3127648 RepID=UPI003106C7A4